MAGGEIADDRARKVLMTDDNDSPMQLVPVSTVLKSKATSDMRGDDAESTSKLCPECWGVGLIILR